MNYEIWNLQRPTYINNLFIKKYFSINLNHTIRNSYINNLFRQTKEFLETSNRRRRHDLDLKANHAKKLLIRIIRNRNGVDFTSKRKEEQIYRDRVRRWTKKFLKRGRLTKDQRVIYFHRQLKREFLSHSMTFRALNSVAKAKTIKPINTSYSLRKEFKLMTKVSLLKKKIKIKKQKSNLQIEVASRRRDERIKKYFLKKNSIKKHLTLFIQTSGMLFWRRKKIKGKRKRVIRGREWEHRAYRTIKRTYFRKSKIAFSPFKASKLKYNLRPLKLYKRFNYFAKWVSKSNSPLFQKTNPLYFTITSSNVSRWYLQQFKTSNSLIKLYKLDYNYNLIYNFIRRESSFIITELLGLTNYIYNNQSMSFNTNIFNFNRNSLLSVGDLIKNKVEGVISENKFEERSIKNILANRYYVLGSLYINQRKTKKLLTLNNVVNFLPRFTFSLQIKHFFRNLRDKAVSCFYYVSPEEFFISSVLYIGSQTKFIPLYGLKTITPTRVLVPKRGIINVTKTNINDNLLELNYDNHLSVPTYLNRTRNVTTLFSTLQHSLASTNHPNSKYTEILSIFKNTFSKNAFTNIPNSKVGISSQMYLMFNDVRYFTNLYSNSLLFKYFFWNKTNLNTKIDQILTTSLVNTSLSDMGKFKFSNRINFYRNSNLWPVSNFRYTVKKRVLKLLHYNKFLPPLIMWYYDTLIKFMEFHSGKKVYVNFNPFVEQWVTYQDRALLSLFSTRVIGFQKILGHRIFVQEALLIFMMAFRYKDPTFLSNWIKAMLYRLSFWKYRLIFRYLKYCMYYLFFDYFEELEFKGLKFTVNGKIGVAGNARTRTLFYAIGETSHSKVNNRVLSHFTTINSFTGVMGFRLTFYF
jgi:hypothetical protein